MSLLKPDPSMMLFSWLWAKEMLYLKSFVPPETLALYCSWLPQRPNISSWKSVPSSDFQMLRSS